MDSPYCTVDDDSGHRYVIPLQHQTEWYELDFEKDEVPHWAERTDNPHTQLKIDMALKGHPIWNEDPTAYYCCSGWECGCRGITNAAYWEYLLTKDS